MSGAAFAKAFGAAFEGFSASVRKDVAAAGKIRITEPTPDRLAAWKAASQPPFAAWKTGGEGRAELLEAYRAALGE